MRKHPHVCTSECGSYHGLSVGRDDIARAQQQDSHLPMIDRPVGELPTVCPVGRGYSAKLGYGHRGKTHGTKQYQDTTNQPFLSAALSLARPDLPDIRHVQNYCPRPDVIPRRFKQ